MHIFMPQLWKSHFPNERCQFIALPQGLLPRRPGAFDARHTPYPQDRGNWCKDLSSFASNIITNPIFENNCKTKTGTYSILYGSSNLFLKVDNVRWRWPSMKLGWDMHASWPSCLSHQGIANCIIVSVAAIHGERWMEGLTATFADCFCYCSNHLAYIIAGLCCCYNMSHSNIGRVPYVAKSYLSVRFGRNMNE